MNAYNAATASVCLVAGMKAQYSYQLSVKFSLPMELSLVTSAVSLSPSLCDDIVQGLYVGVTDKDLDNEAVSSSEAHQSRNLTCHCPGAWQLLVGLVCSCLHLLHVCVGTCNG